MAKALVQKDPLLELIEMDVGMLMRMSRMTQKDAAMACGLPESTLSQRLRELEDMRIGEWVTIRNALRKEARKCGYRVPDIVLDGSLDTQQLRKLLLQVS